MKKSNINIWQFLVYLILGLVSIWLGGCDVTGIVGCAGDATLQQHFTCETKILKCDLKPGQLVPKVDVQITPTSNPDYDMESNLWGEKDKIYRLYIDPEYQEVVFKGTGLNLLKGSLVIKTNSKDWNNTDSAYLQIKLLKEVEGFYVAYDSRIDPPFWLTVDNDYVEEGLIPISLTSNNQLINLRLWRRTTLPPTGTIISLPGNSHELPQWRNKIPADKHPNHPLMYTIIIKPKSILNCNTPKATGKNPIGFEGYFSNENGKVQQTAETTAFKDCQEHLTSLEKCDRPVCTPGGIECRELTRSTQSYPINSVIDFTPTATATITIIVGGQSYNYNTGLTGTLHFKYEPFSKHKFQLNSMVLKGKSFGTVLGNFDDIAIVLLSPATATCQDSAPTFGQPCTHYQIPANDLETNITATLDGKPVVWSAHNLQMINITIDHQKRSFQYSGMIQATMMMLNGQAAPMNIQFGLYGYFLNFAPIAIAKIEGPRSAECVENRNKEPIYLYANDSFDIYTPNPSYLPRYEWYEDFDLVTEHFWGTGPTLTIKSGQLAYGVHSFTLLVADNVPDGIVDKDTFDIEVRDTIPPVFTSVPADILTPIQPPGTKSMYVDIGQAIAYDRQCTTQNAIITNDAPEGLIFPSGVTTVTWRADDARGNAATVIQEVEVRVMSDSILKVAAIVLIAGLLGLGFFVWNRIERKKQP